MTASARTRRPLIARVSAVALAAGLLAGCAAGPVTAPADNPAKAVAAAVAVTQPAPAASPTTEQVALSGRTTTAAAAAAAPATRATSARRQVRKTIHIRSYLDRPGSQAAVDTGKLVLWASKPLWLAGHNYAGWQWLAFVRTGTKVVVTQGRAAGTYVVTGHKRLNRQGGAMPQVTAALVLQTCVGNQTGLTLLRRA
jgi:hypothetical protein